MINSVLGDEELPVGDEEAVRELLMNMYQIKMNILFDGRSHTFNMQHSTYMIRNVAFGTEIQNMEKSNKTYCVFLLILLKINGKHCNDQGS